MVYTQPAKIILGCGNILLGDDGFGPAVVERLNNLDCLPLDAVALDVGTSIREYLLDYLLLPEKAPEILLIIDAVDFSGHSPGELFQLSPEEIPIEKIHDFSLHQFPTVNLLAELQSHSKTNVYIIGVQITKIPNEISPELSPAIEGAVKTACEKILQLVRENT